MIAGRPGPEPGPMVVPMLDGQTESALVEQAVAGDPAALERLLLAHHDQLEARLSSKIPASLRAVIGPEDVMQQTFIAAFQSLGGFRSRGEGAFYGWLCTIAEHRLQDAIKAHRAQKRGGGQAANARPPGFGESMQKMIEIMAASRHSPSQSVARHEATRAIEHALSRLSEDYRHAIELRYMQGLPVAEIAAVMNRTERAIHNLCYRGLRELHAAMGESVQFLTRK